MQQTPCDLQKFCHNFNTKYGNKSLRRYLRDRKGRLSGMLLAYKDNGRIHFGWSKCKTKEDSFRKDFALYVAAHRAMKKELNEIDLNDEKIPLSVRKAVPYFMDKMNKYFKVNV